jgi:hypothetical protein
MIVPLISVVWLVTLTALVARLAGRPVRSAARRERSPSLLATRRASFDRAMAEVLRATPVASSSKPATAEHVGDRAQENLYVRP